MKNFEEDSNKHIVKNVMMPHYNTDPDKCWSVEFYKSNGKKNAKWILKTSDNSFPEYSVKISSLCDVKNEKMWIKYTSFEFALELLSNFKQGHQYFIKWLNK